MAYYVNFHGVKRSPIHFEINVNYPIENVFQGMPVPKEAITSPIKLKARRKHLPDIVFFQAYYVGISASMLRLLEEFCPTAISTFPVDITMSDGHASEVQYHYLNVLEFRDSVVIDDSNSVVRYPGTPDAHRIFYHDKLKIRKEKIEGAHIWHESYAAFPRRRYDIYISDALKAAIKNLKLTGFENSVSVFEL